MQFLAFPALASPGFDAKRPEPEEVTEAQSPGAEEAGLQERAAARTAARGLSAGRGHGGDP